MTTSLKWTYQSHAEIDIRWRMSSATAHESIKPERACRGFYSSIYVQQHNTAWLIQFLIYFILFFALLPLFLCEHFFPSLVIFIRIIDLRFTACGTCSTSCFYVWGIAARTTQHNGVDAIKVTGSRSPFAISFRRRLDKQWIKHVYIIIMRQIFQQGWWQFNRLIDYPRDVIMRFNLRQF